MSRTFAGSPAFPEGARVTLANPQLRANMARATTTIREKRDARVAEMERWEDLRLAGEAIKTHALAHLDTFLCEFESRLVAAGGTVHWASDAAHAQQIILDLVRATGATDVVKIKSMTTAEIDLNGALERVGVRAYETDLAELIVQLGDDLPSHIVVPAIHRNRDEVREIFHDHMGEWGRPAPDSMTNNPEELATAARLHLREKFLNARVAISGANFLVAETGSVAIVESEGNGRMCLTLPETLITIAGIDKIIPRFEDLDVFFQVLPRSATGERMNPYNSVWTGVTPGDGPQNFHVVLLDNGRTSALSDRVGRAALRCIRCAACLNVCPVYEKVGGHAYGSVYPGPIGAVLTPQLNHITDDEVAASLPYASTLCGACFDACPVRIDIPKLLVHLRGEVVATKIPSGAERRVMKAAAWAFARPSRLSMAARLGSLVARVPGAGGLPLLGWGSGWSKYRNLPLPRSGSFSNWWKQNRPASASLSVRPVTPAGPASTRVALGMRPARTSDAKPRSREEILQAILATQHGLTDVVIPREYRDLTALTEEERLERFIDRLRDYHAEVRVVAPGAVAEGVLEALSDRGSNSIVLPHESLRPFVADFSGRVVIDDALSTTELNDITAVLTTATVAIAETGTVILNASATEGRRAITLVPDHHVVIVHQHQIVDQVPDAMSTLSPLQPQTWCSGPSATSDIELSRVEGVHGPRLLDVVIVLD